MSSSTPGVPAHVSAHDLSTHADGPHEAPPRTHRVLVYSDDPAVRAVVRTAIGRRPAKDLGRVEFVEVDQGRKVVAAVDAGGLDLAIFDGEAWPTGGLGLCKQLKDEVRDCPPVLVLVARRDDAWLATWSLADATVPLPVDAPELTSAAVELLRGREAALPVRRAVS
jgi:DNA-binding response OmpR family regulator